MGTNEISNIWAYIIWGIALLWFIGLICYLPQRVSIKGIKCSRQQSVIMSDGLSPVAVSGFIKTRHDVELLDCRLMLVKCEKEYYMASSGFSLQEIIGNTPRSFIFHIPVGNYPLIGDILDWGLVYIKINGKLLHTNPFPIQITKQNKEGWFREMAKKLTPETRRLKDEGEITKRKLHEILSKASQPIKKSEKEKA